MTDNERTRVRRRMYQLWAKRVRPSNRVGPWELISFYDTVDEAAGWQDVGDHEIRIVEVRCVEVTR